MKNGRLVAAAIPLVAMLVMRPAIGASETPTDANRQHSAWVLDSLVKMETIKPGMTRAELLKVFEREGGISSASEAHYVFRDCPYFRVDVVFTLTKPGLVESPSDKIKTISRPYIEQRVVSD